MLAENQVKKDRDWLIGQDDKIKNLCDFYAVGADATRLKILLLLKKHKELCVSDIANVLQITISAISHQLAYLERSGLVKKIKLGQTVCYFLSKEKVKVNKLII